MAKTVLFIHGMFMTPLCWEKWIPRFMEKGYTVLAPAWIYHDGEPAALRANPDPALGKLTLGDLVAQFTQIIGALNEKPVIVGHSMGGLVTQILFNRGLGVAAIAVDSAPPQGVFALSYPFLKSNWPLISPFLTQDKPHLMTFEQFQYAFGNTLPLNEQHAAYERYVVPESRRVGQGSLSSAAKIEYEKTRAPLLLTSGEKDHIIPAVVNRANFKKYRGASNVRLKEFAGRSHFLIGEPGWEEVADYALGWLEGQRL